MTRRRPKDAASPARTSLRSLLPASSNPRPVPNECSNQRLLLHSWKPSVCASRRRMYCWSATFEVPRSMAPSVVLSPSWMSWKEPKRRPKVATLTAAPIDSPTLMWRSLHRPSSLSRARNHSYSSACPKTRIMRESERQSDPMRMKSVGSVIVGDLSSGTSRTPDKKAAAGRVETSAMSSA